MALYLISKDGETLSQSIPAIRERTAFPFTIECVKAGEAEKGQVLKVVGFKHGKYLTEQGPALQGQDAEWSLVG